MHSLKHREIFTAADTKLAIKPMFAEGVTATTSPADEPGEWKCTLTGYPLVWGVLSSDRGGYVVRLMPNSARFTARVMAFWDHNSRDTVGNTNAGTLRLTPDDYGVRCEIDLPDTTAGRDLACLVGRRDITGMSFGMTDTPEGVRVVENGQTILNATGYTVDEVTITALPAFDQTSINIKTEQAAAYAAVRRQQALKYQRLQFQGLQSQAYRLPGKTTPHAVV